MSGQTVFEQLCRNIGTTPSGKKLKITHKDYAAWQKQTSFDIMKGQRYGQSFCNYFGITDNILYYEFSWINAEDYIRQTYLEKF